MSKQAEKVTSPEFLNVRQFNELPISKLKELMAKHCSFDIPKGTKDRFVRDIAQNKLHGTIFHLDSEVQKDGKTIKKPKKTIKNHENCPQCDRKNYILQKFTKELSIKSRKQCEICGYYTEVAN